jgi:uncharacterized protein YoxC
MRMKKYVKILLWIAGAIIALMIIYAAVYLINYFIST